MEDWASVKNLSATNITFMDQVELHDNLVFTKEVENDALQTSMQNLRRAVKNLMAEISNLKTPSHAVGSGESFKVKKNHKLPSCQME